MVYSAANGNDDDEIAVSPKYYCPVSGCKYNYCSGQPTKSFSTARLLKQVSFAGVHLCSTYTNKRRMCSFYLAPHQSSYGQNTQVRHVQQRFSVGVDVEGAPRHVRCHVLLLLRPPLQFSRSVLDAHQKERA